MLKKRAISMLLSILLIVSSISVSLVVTSTSPTTYYIDVAGSNSNTGTSPSTPWADFTNINSRNFIPGDQILLKRGCTWNQEMLLGGSGTSDSWITVDAYGTGAKPKIQRSNGTSEFCITMGNVSYWKIKSIEMCNAAQGITMNYTILNNEGLIFSDIYAHDMQTNFQGYPNAGFWNSNMLNFNALISNSASQYVCRNITIENCETYRTTPPQFASSSGNNATWQNITIRNNYFHDYQGAFSLQNVANVTFVSNQVVLGGNHSTPQGSCNIFLGNSYNCNISNNIIGECPDLSLYDLSGICAEFYVYSTYVRGNYLYNNAGGGYELSGTDHPNNYNYNNIVTGNTFNGNGTTTQGEWMRGSVLATWGHTVCPNSGVLSDNLYYQSSGVFNNTVNEDWSCFTFANNRAVAQSNIYNSANGYNSTQGTNQWSYQYNNGSSWSNLSYDSTSSQWTSNGTSATRFNLLPNSTDSNWVARAWTAPSNGTISIRGRALMPIIDAGGDGVKTRITKNGIVVWPTNETPQVIGSTDNSGIDTGLDGLYVGINDVIRFEVNNGGNGNNTNDWVSWMPTVAYASISADTPAHNWRFENNGIDSIAGKNATVNGGVTYTTGIKNNAASLNGTNGYYSVPDGTTLKGMAALTCSISVKLNALPSGDCQLFEKGNSYRLNVSSNGQVHFAVATTSNGWYTAGTTATSSINLSPGIWYDIVGVYDGIRVYIYINGSLSGIGSQDISGSIVSYTNNLNFGYYITNYFNGRIDEAELYRIGLSSSQVAAKYNSCHPFNLNLPAKAATGVSTNPTFSWSASLDATSYTLLVSTNSDLSSPVVNQTGITSTSYTLDSILANNTTYYWSVRAVYSTGTTDARNSYFNFTTFNVPSPISLWRFESNGTDIIGGRTATSIGGVTYTTGKKNTAASLNGTTGYYSVADNASLKGMSAVTCSIWVKLNALPSGDCQFYEKGNTYRFNLSSSGQVHFAVATTNNGWYSAGTVATASTSLSTNTWYNIVGVYDGSYVYIYINGILSGSGSQNISGNIGSELTVLNFGHSYTNYLNGLIDEAQLYNSGLSSTQVTALYNSY